MYLPLTGGHQIRADASYPPASEWGKKYTNMHISVDERLRGRSAAAAPLVELLDHAKATLALSLAEPYITQKRTYATPLSMQLASASDLSSTAPAERTETKKKPWVTFLGGIIRYPQSVSPTDHHFLAVALLLGATEAREIAMYRGDLLEFVGTALLVYVHTTIGTQSGQPTAHAHAAAARAHKKE